VKVVPSRPYGNGDRLILSETTNVPEYPILPPVTPIPGLDIRSIQDVLSPESARELSEWLRREARNQRLARASAALIPLP
jgi:hypothetical protein